MIKEIGIRGIDGTVFEWVKAHVHGGLAAHRLGTRYWRITHVKTGFRLPGNYKKLSEAVQTISVLNEMYDWHRVSKASSRMVKRCMPVINERAEF